MSNGNIQALQSFHMDLTNFDQSILPEHSVFVKKIAFEVLRGVILKTPVDTGLLRGNWLVSIGSPSDSTIEPKGWDGTEMWGGDIAALTETTINNGLKILARVDAAKQIIYIQNNLAYAEAIEDGHSRVKAPQGMLLLTLEEIKAQLGV